MIYFIYKFFTVGLLVTLLSTTNLLAQKFWLTTYEFPDGPKIGITLTRDTCLFAATEKRILRSFNDGRNFERVLQASAVYSVFATKTGKMMAGGVGKIFISSDLGTSWDSVSLNTVYPVTQFTEGKNGELFAITGALNPEQGFMGDGVFYSADDGRNWSQRNNGLGIYKSCEKIAIDKAGRLYLAVADEHVSGSAGLFISENNGENWEHVAINIDGKNAINDEIKVGNTLGLTISPNDSIYFSFSGVAGKAAVSLNLVKSINEVRNPSQWKPFQLWNTNLWWNDRLLHNIHFAKNGDWYSSSSGSVTTGGTYIAKKNFRKWERTDYGLGLNIFSSRSEQFFAERPNGKIFMVQFLDERIYKTDTSMITTLNPVRESIKEISVFPNPVNKRESFKLKLPENDYPASYSIYNSTGKKISSHTIRENEIIITAPELPGIYFIVREAAAHAIRAKLTVL